MDRIAVPGMFTNEERGVRPRSAPGQPVAIGLGFLADEVDDSTNGRCIAQVGMRQQPHLGAVGAMRTRSA